MIEADKASPTVRVSGISSVDRVAMIRVNGNGLMGEERLAARLISTLAEADIAISLINQSCSESSVCIDLATGDVSRARALVEAAFAQDLERQRIDHISFRENLAIVALVGWWAGACGTSRASPASSSPPWATTVSARSRSPRVPRS